ncbi:MAG: hypothetical protein Fur0014_10720 [Rubrivivax sp.]
MGERALFLRRSWPGLMLLAWPLAGLADTYVLAIGDQAVEQTNSGVGWYETARAAAGSAQGVGKISVRAVAFTEPTDGYPVAYRTARAEAVTAYTDSLTFSGAGIAPGTLATVVFGLRFDYAGLAVFTGGGPGVINQDGGALWSMRQTLGGNQFSAGCSWNTSANGPSVWDCSGFDPTGPSPEKVSARPSFTATVVFGQPLNLDFYATAQASMTVYAQAVGYYASGDLSLDLGNSFYWDGIDAVTVDGLPVDFTVTSASGTDYAASLAPVPEPGTALLWAGGLAGLLAERRRRAASGGMG